MELTFWALALRQSKCLPDIFMNEHFNLPVNIGVHRELVLGSVIYKVQDSRKFGVCLFSDH